MAKPPYRQKGPYAPLEIDDMFRSFRQAVNREGEHPASEIVNYTPQLDIYSKAESIVIEVELPGVKLKDIDLSFTKGTLIVKGHKYESLDEDTGNYICMERGYGKFYRSIEMPYPVNSRNIKAFYSNGILSIEAEKIEDKRGLPKKIEIEYK